MTNQVQTLADRIDKLTEGFTMHFGSLTAEELNWKPKPETWSIAQNIDHIMVINKSYFPLFSDLRSGTFKTPFTAKFGFLVSFFGKTILKASGPERGKKIKTFPIWEPSQSGLPNDLLKQFSDHQEELKQEIQSCSENLNNQTVISSPANRNIVYKLETAFEVIVTHEQRHLVQAQETLKAFEQVAG